MTLKPYKTKQYHTFLIKLMRKKLPTLLPGFSSISGTPGTPEGGCGTKIGSWIGFMGGGSSHSSSTSSPLAISAPGLIPNVVWLGFKALKGALPRDLAPFRGVVRSSSSSPSDTDDLLLPISVGGT